MLEPCRVSLHMCPRNIKIICCFLVLITIIWNVWLYIDNNDGDWRNIRSKSVFSQWNAQGNSTFEANKKTSRRRTIIIVGHGRSGTSILGDIFNHHPSVFYIFEPLHFLDVVLKGKRPRAFKPLATDLLSDVLHCKFDKAFTMYIHLRGYRFPDFDSIAIRSPPLCPLNMTDPRWTLEICPALQRDDLEKVCRNNYDVTVIKVLSERLESVQNVWSVCNSPDIDCKIIFLIRDPRAVVISARKVHFFRDDQTRNGLRQYSIQKCQVTENNLKIIKNNVDFWRDRIFIQRYEDFAVDPLKTLSRLFKFARLSEENTVKIWLNRATHASRQEVQELCKKYDKDFCTSADSAQRVNRWRRKASLRDILTIEHHCKRTMKLMGYKSINRSQSILSDVRIPLFSKEYVANSWFLTKEAQETN